jgi:AcrR family transcriptional regulator
MSPRTPSQFEEMREEKKNLIMDVALEHFSNIGFHPTTITHIARHAGISKGLMYNYFRSKEDLLASIINRSIADIYTYFNPDHDSHLTPDEFELFIRKIFHVLHEKRQFWKLLYRIMLQPGVYEKIFSEENMNISVSGVPLREFSENMAMLLTDYFERKKERAGPDYDPRVELLMFSNAVKGFAMTSVFSAEQYQGDYFERVIDALLKRYK